MKFIAFLFSLAFVSTVSAFSVNTPPDSTSNLAQRTAATMVIEEAKHYYSEGHIKEALAMFKQAEVKDPASWKASYWVALCYFRLNNFTMALKNAEEARRKDTEVDADLSELLGRCFHQNAQLDSAIANYSRALTGLSKQRAEDLHVWDKIEECKYAKLEVSKNKPFARKLVSGDVNTEFNEYAPILIQNGSTLYFAARKSNTTGGMKNPDDEQFFEDIYRAKWNEKFKMWDSVTNKIDKLNGPGFETFTYVSEDGTRSLLTLNTTQTELETQTESSDICELDYKAGKWSKPKIINNETINTSYYDGAATMTADGSMMVFVSDRNGETSSMDLFIVRKDGKKWGEAIPMPAHVNSLRRETTPYLTPDGKFLFFSSDGHKGMGGYDVYVTQNNGGTWSKPINLGASINTVNDDTHFQYYKALNRAMMAGITLDEMQCNYNIYEVNLSEAVLPISFE
jgi:tetratricopeptide (TPR) repeat protein